MQLISYSERLHMPKGGYRFGAGRPSTKAKAEQLPRIDLSELRRKGLLNLGDTFTWRWSKFGEVIGSVSAKFTDTHSLALRNASWTQRIELDYTECHFGGRRLWMRCYQCNCRCSVVYLRSQSFSCRKCSKVSYTSQSEDYCGRLWRKQAKLESKLGGGWSRPKGMHRKTHNAVFEKIVNCEEQREEEFVRFAQRIMQSDRY